MPLKFLLKKMANDKHLFSVPCYNETMLKRDYYNDFFDIGLAGLPDAIDTLYAKYNAVLYENGYGPRYDVGQARMFVIEGMEKVRKVIEENRRRKLTKHKEISNNTILEIDNCSPLEILKLQKNLARIAQGEGILFVSRKRSFRRISCGRATSIMRIYSGDRKRR